MRAAVCNARDGAGERKGAPVLARGLVGSGNAFALLDSPWDVDSWETVELAESAVATDFACTLAIVLMSLATQEQISAG